MSRNHSQGARKRVTLRQIAEVFGVSSMTVSLALRNHPRISELLRKQIQDKALEMNYRPDPMLKALASYRHNQMDKPMQSVLAWMNCWPKPADLRRFRLFDEYWKGAVGAAEHFGYKLEEFVVREDMTAQRLWKILHTRNVRGILLPPGPLLTDWREFPWGDFSLVGMSRQGSSSGFSTNTVVPDQVSNAILAFDQARAKGYKRVGFAGVAYRDRHFGAGILWAQTELPKSQRLAPFRLADEDSPEMKRNKLRVWLQEEKPDAILTEISKLPEMLEELGYRVPDDIGVATMDVLDSPIDAGIWQNPEEVGRVAVTVLVSLSQDNDRGEPRIPRQIMVKGAWVDGDSLPDRT